MHILGQISDYIPDIKTFNSAAEKFLAEANEFNWFETNKPNPILSFISLWHGVPDSDKNTALFEASYREICDKYRTASKYTFEYLLEYIAEEEDLQQSRNAHPDNTMSIAPWVLESYDEKRKLGTLAAREMDYRQVLNYRGDSFFAFTHTLHIEWCNKDAGLGFAVVDDIKNKEFYLVRFGTCRQWRDVRRRQTKAFANDNS